MSRGSGIATYARNLQSSLRAMGHETQMLFSSTQDEDATDLMREVTLLDAGGVAPSNRVRAVIRSLARPPRLQAWPIQRTGEVITRDIESRYPPCDRTWAGARRLRQRQPGLSSRSADMSPITLGRDESQTDLTHWTCALPLYEPRTPNVYTLHDLVPLRLPYTTLDNKRGFHCAVPDPDRQRGPHHHGVGAIAGRHHPDAGRA